MYGSGQPYTIHTCSIFLTHAAFSDAYSICWRIQHFLMHTAFFLTHTAFSDAWNIFKWGCIPTPQHHRPHHCSSFNFHPDVHILFILTFVLTYTSCSFQLLPWRTHLVHFILRPDVHILFISTFALMYTQVALFFGTGNQTPMVSSAIIARVFLDPDLKLFDYCPERLLNSVPVRHI